MPSLRRWVVAAVLVATVRALPACTKRDADQGAAATAPKPATSLSSDQRAKLTQIVEAGKQRAKALDDERHAAVEKLAKNAPRTEPGACAYDPAKLVPPHPSTADTKNGQRALTAKRQSWALDQTEIVQPGKPTYTKIAAGSLERALEPVLAKSAPDKRMYPPDSPDMLVAEAEKIVKNLDDGHDLVLVVTEVDDPVADGPSTYKPGRLVGTLHAWSRAQHAFECAAPVQGDGSGTVNVTVFKGLSAGETTASALHGDLLTSAIIGHLSKLAPLASKP